MRWRFQKFSVSSIISIIILLALRSTSMSIWQFLSSFSFGNYNYLVITATVLTTLFSHRHLLAAPFIYSFFFFIFIITYFQIMFFNSVIFFLLCCFFAIHCLHFFLELFCGHTIFYDIFYFCGKFVSFTNYALFVTCKL